MYAPFWRFLREGLQWNRQPGDDPDHATHDLRLIRHFPRFRHAAGERVRLHYQPGPVLLKPAAAVTIMQFNEIHWAVVLRRPLALLNPPYRHIDQHHASRSQDWRHTAVAQSDAAVTMMAARRSQEVAKIAGFRSCLR